MDPVPTSADVVVVGAGVIGLASAWRLAQHGLRVVVCDPHPASGASSVAAGMLAPVTELHYGEEPLLALTLASARCWPEFAQQLHQATGAAVGWNPTGTLLATVDSDDRRWAQDLLRFQLDLQMPVSWLTARQARQLEPGLAPGISGAIWAPEDHQVDNRALLSALVAAATGAGAVLVPQAVSALCIDSGVVTGADVGGGHTIAAASVVLCAGWQSNDIAGLPPELVPPVRPVKGQILRLTHPPGAPRVLGRTVRAMVQGSSVYIVPRASGEVVVGATSEEKGADRTATAGGVYELLRDAVTVAPGLRELVLDEVSVGLRPGSPDNAPVVGAAPLGAGADGLVVATGHYRNGILLAPVTAQAVVASVTGTALPDAAVPFGIERFQKAPAPAAGTGTAAPR